ncbi:hypothetical protein QIK31_gp1 [ssRNA phage SRR6253161_1]|uniref:Uncharacterized protein n=1 Tax=ssRNA phage SRR6253161_1 TaxID=2786488 RepID=A0A8S5KYW8_9VIRU|nr:hypothetical protein QIK31_gp1 [ssRNA phage SRR6253161_1]DAD50934.1 TPA_asm: hypothetical protein [ssRNA phage SRR6253161_1]
MRNFSQIVPQSSVIAIPCGMGRSVDSLFAKYSPYLLKAFECDSLTAPCLTRSEEATLADFRHFLFDVHSKEWTSDMTNSVFVYHNMNTGESFVFVAWCGYEDYGVSHKM